MKTHLLRLLLSSRTCTLIFLHVVLIAISYEMAHQLRFDLNVPQHSRSVFWWSLPWIVAIKLICFWRFGNLHGWWRYVTFADLAALLRVTTLSTLVIAAVDYFAVEEYQISRVVLVLDWGCTVMLIGGLRSIWRLTREQVLPAASRGRPALMIGSGTPTDAQLTRLIHHQAGSSYRVVGFLHESSMYRGSRLGGIPFLGRPDEAVQIASERKISDILVMTNGIGGDRLRVLTERCNRQQIKVKMVPGINELLNGSFNFYTRDVDIEDLLRREPVRLDSEAIDSLLKGRRVMVTGAGGSIGSEICRQVLKRAPQSLVLVERHENSLFFIDRKLRSTGCEKPLVACLADVCDEERMRTIFQQHRPHIVFHSAAHKHVPLIESNPGEAIKNNVFGTIGLADMANEFGVEKFTFISTDKAVNPMSAMGVSKQLAERYLLAASRKSSTRFVVVRFGNVLASSGSVVPVFHEQIRRGGPVTVTHPEMTRYFMTIPEASQLVLQAAAMGKGGEIFILDMGQPVKILDLAQEMIRLYGHSPTEIAIKFTGVRPGEKLSEELYSNGERIRSTHHPKVHVACHEAEALDGVRTTIAEVAAVLAEPPDALRNKLKELARGYAAAEPPTPEIALDTRLPARVAVEPS